MQRFTSLHKAAQRGDEAETKHLLQEGADVSIKDSEGRNPLHHAVMRGHLGVVQLLMEQGPPEMLLSKDILGCTPVHLAAVQNQVTLILMLVSALLRDEKGTTPLHEIARRKCLQDFMGFLHLGWDIAAREESAADTLTDRLSPEWEAAATEIDLKRPGLTAVRSVMGWAPLHMAAMEGKVGLIRRLVKEFGCSLTQRSANSWTPLHYAAAHNQVEAIEELVKLGCDADVKDSVSSTPMHVAAGEGHLEAILLLVQLGCAAAVKDRDGCTPLYCAAAWNQVEAVRQLDRLGCPSWQKSLEGRTPVHVAAEQGWADLIDLLVKELKNKVDSRDTYQFTPLHSAANGGHVKTIQKLIHFSHDVDVKDYLGRTPLHYAAMHGRVGAITELVRQGASLREKDIRGGYTPLHLAADTGQCEAISTLVALGAPLEAKTAKGWTPLGLATFKGPVNVDAIASLIELGSKVGPVLESSALETPLHIAARCGRLDIIDKLLRCNVPVNVRAKDGSYPLHYAAAFGQSHVVEALIRAGCPVNCRDDAQNTPLHLAAGCGFHETVEKLVELGADMNARDVMSCTPLQNAAHGTYSALAAMPASTSAASNGGSQSAQRGVVTGLPLTGTTQSGQQSLTAAQTATQLAISTGSTARNGKVPVRTGLAWASIGLSGTGADWTTSLWGSAATGSEAEASSHAGMGLMQLLKRATRRRNGTSSLTADYSLGLTVKSDTEKIVDGGLEALLRRSEALRAGGLEQDRSRLLTVAERLVQLGAEVDARDAEGRTALHLAAGCGDSSMVLQLVQLGSHVDCRDSVGGTPMHHAAMANKKEMMFELARLGCDWRARADGIDGATAAFVLCGQHGKTTRQQKLVEAKLKRVFQEGLTSRNTGGQLSSLQDITDLGEGGEDADAVADANMAALLKMVQLEGQGKELALAKRRRKKKKPKGKVSANGDKASDDGLQDESFLQDPIEEETAPVDVGTAAQSEEEAASEMEPLDSASSLQASAGRPSSAAASRQGSGVIPDKLLSATAAPDPATQAQDAARRALDDAIALVITELDRQRQAPDAADELEAAFTEAAERLDGAVAEAVRTEVSAKYGKKVRKRLQCALDVLQGKIPPQKPETPRDAAPHAPPFDDWNQDAESDDNTVPEPPEKPADSLAPSTAKPANSRDENGRLAASSQNGHSLPKESPRVPAVSSRPASRSFQKAPPDRADGMVPGQTQMERGQEVQKPTAKPGISRTPKRVAVASKVPAPSIGPPPTLPLTAASARQKPPHVTTAKGPTSSPQAVPRDTAPSRQPCPPPPRHDRQPAAAPTPCAPSRPQVGSHQPHQHTPWSSFPTGHQWTNAAPSAEPRLPTGGHHNRAPQHSRPPSWQDAAAQSAFRQHPVSSQGQTGIADQVPRQLLPPPQSALHPADSGTIAAQPAPRHSLNLQYSDLSATAPHWVPSGARTLQGSSTQSVQQAVTDARPSLVDHDRSSIDSSNRSLSASPSPQLLQSWQASQQMQSTGFLGGSGSVLDSNGPAFSRLDQGFSQGFLNPWNPGQQHSTQATSSQIWQGQGFQDSKLPGWSSLGVAKEIPVPSLPHLSAGQLSDETGGSPDYANFIDHSIGSELAASVLSSEEPRNASRGLPFFDTKPGVPTPRPGYGQLW